MSKKNKKYRKKLEKIFGKVDMFDEANLEHIYEEVQKQEKRKIKTYKQFEQEKRYKGKQISDRPTYHHLKHKSEGGPTNVENGARIGDSKHQYMHSLPRDIEEIGNEAIRGWKANFMIMRGDGEIEEHGTIEPDFSDCITIPAFDGPPPKKQIDKRKRTRAQEKRELQDLIDEYYDEIDDDEFER